MEVTEPLWQIFFWKNIKKIQGRQRAREKLNEKEQRKMDMLEEIRDTFSAAIMNIF